MTAVNAPAARNQGGFSSFVQQVQTRYNPHDGEKASSGSWHSKNWDCAMEGEHCGDGAFSKDVKGTGKGSWHSSNWLDEDKSSAQHSVFSWHSSNWLDEDKS